MLCSDPHSHPPKHKGTPFPMSDEAQSKDFVLPIGKAKVEKEGTDVTITAFSKMVGYSLEAAEILAGHGINCEVINLRSIRPLDTETIIESVKKTNRLVNVEEGWPQHGVGAEICGTCRDQPQHQRQRHRLPSSSRTHPSKISPHDGVRGLRLSRRTGRARDGR